MKRLVFLFCLTFVAFAFSSNTFAQTPNEKTVAAIRAVLDAQVAAWNRGDIAGFMEGYWKSEQTVFISGGSKTKGWQTVLDRYKRGYTTREQMGTLAFTDLEYNELDSKNVIVTGRWELKEVKDNPRGRFTLIFRKVKEGWRVVHDHTSSG